MALVVGQAAVRPIARRQMVRSVLAGTVQLRPVLAAGQGASRVAGLLAPVPRSEATLQLTRAGHCLVNSRMPA